MKASTTLTKQKTKQKKTPFKQHLSQKIFTLIDISEVYVYVAYSVKLIEKNFKKSLYFY